MSTHTFPIYRFAQSDSLEPRLPFEQGPAVVMECLMRDSHMPNTYRQDNNYLSVSTQTVDFVASVTCPEARTDSSISPWRPNTRLHGLHT